MVRRTLPLYKSFPDMHLEVTHPVVSQANPHVHLFFFAPRGSAGKPVAHRKGKGNQRAQLSHLVVVN